MNKLIIYTPILLLHLLLLSPPIAAVNAAVQELLKGFTATPDPSIPSFQPLLTDSIGNYSFGFLRVDRTQLAVAVVHVASGEPLWVAEKSPLAPWSSHTRISFNGSLVISNAHTRAFWSSHAQTNGNGNNGHRVRLYNTSNLLILTEGEPPSVVWQSFDFPYNTLVENQNFTSAMKLISSNRIYSMKLGPDFIGFYANFVNGPDSEPGSDPDPGHLYFQHNPMETRSHVTKGLGPIHAVLSPDGFLGLYQNGSAQVDLQPFSSFQQPGNGNRIIRLEPDGNLIGYYWTGSGSWVVDFRQISNPCDLPSSCGPYGLCRPGNSCACLDGRNESSGGRCETAGGDFCRKKHRVLRKIGVELANKEIMGYTIMGSLEKCERTCEEDCTCRGAVYSNTSGFCYRIAYPVQSVVEVMDESKVGYFKVGEGAGEDKMETGLWVGLGLLFGGLVLLMLGVGGVFLYRRRSRGVKGYEEEGINGEVGPYKRFKSIELSER